MFLGKIHRELLDNFSGIPTEGAEKRTVTIHDDESELLVRFEKLAERLGMELVITKIQRCVDRLEGLEIDVYFPFFSFRGNDFTTVDNQAIWRYLVIQFETLLSGRNCRKHGESIHT